MRSLTRNALIVGAGIGGLSAGIALRQAGWNIRIFERAASPRELGFGLCLAPTAIAALGELGVADVVLARAFTPRRGELRRMDGTVLKRAELPPGALGGPMVLALRPALHGALLEAVGLDAIALSAEVTGFTVTGNRVFLHIHNGANHDVAEGDLLVGADGVNSVIRHALWGKGVVTLVGDAAHPLLPHTGQGAAQAIVDAVTLGRALSADGSIERSLRSYEVEQRAKTASLLGQGRRTARVMRTTNPFACYFREVVVRLIPVKPFVKIFVRINRRAGTDIGR